MTVGASRVVLGEGQQLEVGVGEDEHVVLGEPEDLPLVQADALEEGARARVLAVDVGVAARLRSDERRAHGLSPAVHVHAHRPTTGAEER